jgi:hypothetical protein
MRKKIILVSVIFILITSCISINAKNDSIYEISIKYDFEKPVINKIDVNDKVYDQVIIPKLASFSDPGEPCLPVKGAYILIPPDSDVKDIIVTSSIKQVLNGEFNVLPSSKPVPISSKNEFSEPIPNIDIYESNDLFPNSLYEKIGVYQYRGFSILVLRLHPVQYEPLTGQILYYSDFNVKVITTNEKTYSTNFRGLPSDYKHVEIKIDNPGLINELYTEKSTISQDSYQYMILTVDDLKSEFEPLKQIQNEKGIITEIKTLNDIALIPSQVTPEDIREYLRQEYQTNNIEYVLLAGDADVIPAKMLYVKGMDEDIYPVSTIMPSDLYFACLDGTYNYDGDNLWGEPNDGDDGSDVDLYADLNIGRACVDNVDDASRFVEKTIEYLTTDANDPYLSKILFAGEHLGNYGVASWGGNYLDLCIDEVDIDGYTTQGIPSDKYDIEKLYDRDWPGNYWTTEEIIERINNNPYIINHDGHANYGYNMKMVNSEIYSFTNEKGFFAYSVGCMSGGFDDPDGYDCFAEYLTVKTDNAAFAVIMNARYGWFWSFSTDGDGTRYTREFWDAVFSENIPNIAMANQDSKEDNLFLIDRSCMRWTYYELNYFGDPTMIFYISQPPDKPIINGPVNGNFNESYDYEISTVDPDGDDIQYYVEFEEGAGFWTEDFYQSGETVILNWTFSEKAIYIIRVKARDINGVESDWATLEVSIPNAYSSSGGLFTGTVTVRNRDQLIFDLNGDYRQIRNKYVLSGIISNDDHQRYFQFKGSINVNHIFIYSRNFRIIGLIRLTDNENMIYNGFFRGYIPGFQWCRGFINIDLN